MPKILMKKNQKKEMIMSAIMAYKNGSFIDVAATYKSIKAEGYLDGLLAAFNLKKTVDTLESVVIEDETGNEYIRWERTK